jgi:hypothetical protein
LPVFKHTMSLISAPAGNSGQVLTGVGYDGFGSRPRANAEAKKALRILFPSAKDRRIRLPQDFFALLDVFALHQVFLPLIVVS